MTGLKAITNSVLSGVREHPVKLYLQDYGKTWQTAVLSHGLGKS